MRFVSGVLFLQFFQLRAHFFHFQVIFAHRRLGIDIQRQGNGLENERKNDDTQPDVRQQLYDPFDEISQKVEPLAEIGIIEIDGFDMFMLKLYYSMDNRNELIDKTVALKEYNKKLRFNLKRKAEFIKLNAFVAKEYPLCNVFKTDFTSSFIL